MSKYLIENYFEGFVVGISATPTIQGAHVCITQKANVQQIGHNWDNLVVLLEGKHISEWSWKSEYNQIVQFACTAMAQAVAINSTCGLEQYFWLLREKYISSWDLWYAHIIH